MTIFITVILYDIEATLMHCSMGVLRRCVTLNFIVSCVSPWTIIIMPELSFNTKVRKSDIYCLELKRLSLRRKSIWRILYVRRNVVYSIRMVPRLKRRNLSRARNVRKFHYPPPYIRWNTIKIASGGAFNTFSLGDTRQGPYAHLP